MLDVPPLGQIEGMREKSHAPCSALAQLLCHNCRICSTRQVHGLGTAMKILFADEGPDKMPLVRLTRNEVVALFNTLAQYVRRGGREGLWSDLNLSAATLQCLTPPHY